MKYFYFLLATFFSLNTVSHAEISQSLQNEYDAAVQRGIDWLLAKQQEDGHWSSAEYPALTGLAMWTVALHQPNQKEVLKKGADFILSCTHENGAIYVEPKEERKGGGLASYNTALCISALNALGDPAYNETILKGRSFIADSQHLGSDVYRGGMGYDASTKRAYADLSNSYIAYEAMRLTENVEDFRKDGEKKADLDWKAAQAFVSRIQNRPESNPASWATDAPNEHGGFAYHPEESKAGTFTNAEGVVKFHSYGSMTYAGLLSFIYAEVDKTDPRVTSAFSWATKHWSLEENPGMGKQGLYYFYNVLSKGLAAFGKESFTAKEKELHWREVIIKKLISLQKIDANGKGYWSNENSRWFEADPVLVTSYTLIALHIASPKLDEN